MADLFKIADSIGEHRASAIFLHGLGGHPYQTWGGSDAQSCWLGWLAEDIEGLAVWSVGYEAPISRWRGSAMHLTDRARNILMRLLAEPALREGSLILIGHSLGGLVIKQLLRTAESEARHRQDAANFIARIEKVVFLGTPHTGSGLANWGDWLRIMVRPSAATISLVRNDPNLRDLNLWYRTWANSRNISHLVLTEAKGLRILGTIVKPDSSDPGLAEARPIPIDGTHLTLCKPKDRTSDIYIQAREFITRRYERPKSPGEEKLDALSDSQSSLLEKSDSIIKLLQREKGIPRAALVGHLTRLGARHDIADDEIPNFLERFANEFSGIQEQLRRTTNDDPEVLAVRKQVADLLDADNLDGAKALLTNARLRIRELRQQQSREEAALLGDEGRIDRLQLNYRTAASKFAEAAALLTFDAEAGSHYLVEQGSALYSQGEELGDNSALVEAVAVWRRVAEIRSRTVSPLHWAMTQNNLGNALRALGERESGTEKLEEAVTAYREALKEWTRERVPLEWAMAQSNLGVALDILGNRDSGTAKLEESVIAHREALKERTRERVPLEWAMSQSNLGSALCALAERENPPVKLEEAVTAFREALKELTRERVPLQWAQALHNLGGALFALGQREPGTAKLEEAATAFRDALKERRRERVPLYWAMTQNNLGNALSRLGERESGTTRLEEAVTAFREALNERTHERMPLQWATTQNNLGNALLALGRRESGTARLEEAVTAFREALKERARERVPLDWAKTQNNLGTALRALGERENGTVRFEEAVTAFHQALKELTRERVPLQWAATQNNLGNALYTLGQREGGTAKLEEAVAAYREALKERTPERVPLEWAMSLGNQGIALMYLAEA
jgi:tetratricopeptide (TPR) repeat protein/pimeloyl-ACP methyl ester carboxylesterase